MENNFENMNKQKKGKKIENTYIYNGKRASTSLFCPI